MPEALTNFPNGISTSIVVLSDEGQGFARTGIESNVDIANPFINPAIVLHSEINMNVANPPPPFSGFGTTLYVSTQIIGPATATNGVIPLFFAVNASGVAANAAVKPEFAGMGFQFNSMGPDKFAGNIYGISIGPLALGLASTLTTVRGIYIQGITCDSSIAGGTSSALDIIMPNGSASGAGTVVNTGLNITGNGSATATQNWAIFSSSTAPSYFAGPLIQHPSVSTIPVNNGDVTVSATSNTQLTVRLKGTDGTVRAVVLTLA